MNTQPDPVKDMLVAGKPDQEIIDWIVEDAHCTQQTALQILDRAKGIDVDDVVEP